MPKRSISKRSILFLIAFALITLAVIGVAPLWEVQEESTAIRTFTIDQSMSRVRKILVRTNAAKKIIAGADAQLLDQEWLNMAFEMPQQIFSRDWHLNGDGQLSVQTNDPYLGQHTMTLDQKLDIRPERLHVTNRLAETTDGDQTAPIAAYDSMMELTPDDQGQAFFRTTLDLTVVTTAGWFTKGIVASEIRLAAARSLEQQESAIRSVVAEQDGKLIVMPEALRNLMGSGHEDQLSE